jgi:biotin synthase
MTIDKGDLLTMLQAQGHEREELFAKARRARATVFGDRVVVRAVCEVTNLCRVDCDFCPMRRSNTTANSPYQLSPEELVAAARRVQALGVNVICFQGGEIPHTTKTLASAIPAILGLYSGAVEILLGLGSKPRVEYVTLRLAGATSYILKHETSDPALHAKLRHESLADRLACLGDLRELGYRIGTGTIVGLPGQTLSSLADDILLARDFGVHMCSASPFIPAPDTPLADQPPGDVELTLNVIATMRLTQPAWTIPSVSGMAKLAPDGQRRGLEAGANVLNFNATPTEHRDRYLIYGRDRRVVGYDDVQQTIAAAGLQPGGSVFVRATA